MNKEWVDEKLKMLFLKLEDFKLNSREFFYEPTDHVYEKLESGDEHDLQHIATEMARHLEIVSIPVVKYEWGLKMEMDVAGRIKVASPGHPIEVPIFYVGKKYAVGAILAHELTHLFLFSNEIWIQDPNENEMLTDLAGVFVGFGKLLLNGLIVVADEYQSEAQVLGYLSPELVSYCYDKVNTIRSISEAVAIENLTPEAKNRIHDH